MKKLISFLIIITAFSFLGGCAVNSNTGKITITNISDIPAQNVKVAGTLVAMYVPAGGVYDYWFSANFSGKLSADGFEMVGSSAIDFEVNHHGSISLYKANDDYYIYGETGDKQGDDFGN